MGYMVSSIFAVSSNDRHSYFLYFIPSDDQTFDDEYKWVDKWVEQNFSKIAALVGPTGVIIKPTSSWHYYLGGLNVNAMCLFEEVQHASGDQDIKRLHSGFPYFVFSKSPLQRTHVNSRATTINLARFRNEKELDSLLEILIHVIRTDEWEVLNEIPEKLQIKPNVFDAGHNFANTLDNLAQQITSTKNGRVSILFLAADPTNSSRLRLGEEFREIDEQITLAKQRDHFILVLPQLSLRPKDIVRAFLNSQPQIVHFSGHGTSEGALCFENEMGQVHLVQPDTLAALFEQFTGQVNCVLLNACYSESQAYAIAQHVNYVIGMNKAIGDKAAIAFTIGFYQALGGGRAIEDAFKLGCVQIRLQGISEHLTPVLIKKGQAQP